VHAKIRRISARLTMQTQPDMFHSRLCPVYQLLSLRLIMLSPVTTRSEDGRASSTPKLEEQPVTRKGFGDDVSRYTEWGVGLVSHAALFHSHLTFLRGVV
jgi:hypothetical protein